MDKKETAAAKINKAVAQAAVAQAAEDLKATAAKMKGLQAATAATVEALKKADLDSAHEPSMPEAPFYEVRSVTSKEFGIFFIQNGDAERVLGKEKDGAEKFIVIQSETAAQVIADALSDALIEGMQHEARCSAATAPPEIPEELPDGESAVIYHCQKCGAWSRSLSTMESHESTCILPLPCPPPLPPLSKLTRKKFA